MPTEIPERLAAELTALTTAPEYDGGPPGDLGDEHVRWAAYQVAADREALWHRLLRCVQLEPDEYVASSVAELLLPRLARSERPAWVRAVAARGPRREFIERRCAELAILQDLEPDPRDPDPDRDPEDAEARQRSVGDWSNWLQLRAAEQCSIPRVLAELATDGRTKRIRSLAERRLREQRKARRVSGRAGPG